MPRGLRLTLSANGATPARLGITHGSAYDELRRTRRNSSTAPKTAGELFGRALVVIAAEQHACRLVVPSSQQFGAKRWPSHRDHAAKALQKLAGRHLPATLKQLEKAIAKAGAELHDAPEQARAESHSRAVAARRPSSTEPDAGAIDNTAEPAETADERELVDDDLVDEQLEDEDLVDAGSAVGCDGDGHSDTPPPAA
jgi:hypothetical protein